MRKVLFLAVMFGALVGAQVALAQDDEISCSLMGDDVAFQTYLKFGDDARDTGDWRQAVQYYTCATRLKPDEAEAYRRRGKIYLDRLKYYDLAITDYTRVLEHDPTDPVAFLNRGWAYYNLKQYPQAADEYTRAISFDSDYALAYNNRGLAKMNMGDFVGAVADFNKAMEKDKPDDSLPLSWPYNNRGIAYANLFEAEKAIDDHKKAIELEPVFADPYYRLGDLLFNEGRYSEAIPYYKDHLRLAGDNAVSHVADRLAQLEQTTDWVRLLPVGIIGLIVAIAAVGTGRSLWLRRRRTAEPRKRELPYEEDIPVRESEPAHPIQPVATRQSVPVTLVLLPILVMATSAIAYILVRGGRGQE
jgi:tetratricopeptide (TPR) repeat protein